MEYICFESSLIERKAKAEAKKISETLLVKIGKKNFVSKEGANKIIKLRIHSSYFTNKDLEDLKYFPNLKLLEIFSFNVTQLHNIPILEKLETFCLRLGETSLDLSPLENFGNLKKIDFEGCGITDLSPLSKLKKLKSVKLSYNKINDLSGLQNSKSITELKLYCNQIEDISALASFKKLKELQIQNNRITDITPLGECKELRILYIWSNKISDIKPLSECNQLNKLEIFKNNIQSAEPIRNMTNLEYITTDRDDKFNILNSNFEQSVAKVYSNGFDREGYEIFVFKKQIK